MNTILPHTRRRGSRGFTLVEILMVLAIIGILVSVAVPSYQRYVYRAEAAELVLKMDRLRGALIELEAVTGKRIGSDLLVWVNSGQVGGISAGQTIVTPSERALVWCPVTTTGSGRATCGQSREQRVNGLTAADLESTRLGIRLVPAAVAGPRLAAPGAYTVSVIFPGDTARGGQVGRAFVELMRPHAARTEVYSRAAMLEFRLSGSTKP